jgi:hypothetical protein
MSDEQAGVVDQMAAAEIRALAVNPTSQSPL